MQPECHALYVHCKCPSLPMDLIKVVLTHLFANAATMAVLGVLYFNFVLWSDYLITYVISRPYVQIFTC